jgi:hypothetical protein
LKEKIGKFMERKERNAEGKTFACQITSFISAMFYKIFTKKKVYISHVIIFKNEKVFLKLRSIKLYTFELYFSLIIFVLNPNNKTFSFSVAENELNKLDFG